MDKAEIWRPVVGSEGWYSVSNLGRVRRDRGGRGTSAGRIMKPNVRRSGHLAVALCMDQSYTSRQVHSLVAEAFVGPRPPMKEINHLDGNPANNRVENLEYCTHSENIKHAVRIGLQKIVYGEDHSRSKLTEDQVLVMRTCSAPIEVVARVFGVSKSTVKAVRGGRLWKHVHRAKNPTWIPSGA